MYRFALCIIAAALAAACARPRPLTAIEIDRRAEHLSVEGRWDEASQLIERGLAEARERRDQAAEARLLLRRGHAQTERTRHRGGDRAPALADLEVARSKAAAIGDRALLAAAIDAIGMHGFVHWFSTQDASELAAAERLFLEALAIRKALSDSPGLAESHFHAGLIHQMRNEQAAAHGEFEQALAVAERVHDPLQMSHATRHLGYLAELRQAWPEAEEYYRRSLELREQVGDGPGVAAAQVTLAELRYARHGDAEPPLQLLARARDGAARTRSPVYVAIASAAIARIDRDRGRYDVALRALADALRAMDEIHSDEDVPEMYEQMALIHLLRGDPASAVADAERGLARRPSPRREALRAWAQAWQQRSVAAKKATTATASQVASELTSGAQDAVVEARRALAAGDANAGLEAALRGDDPDTLLLAARAVGEAGFDRAIAAAAKLSRAQELRFVREKAAGALR
ncbi:MAG TPA: tetratricopeptide repeat protein [Kofleriaceae bacterium]|nr:tetratricopeptide repeat protein [Kofleriaceae bacterium]